MYRILVNSSVCAASRTVLYKLYYYYYYKENVSTVGMASIHAQKSSQRSALPRSIATEILEKVSGFELLSSLLLLYYFVITLFSGKLKRLFNA